jgi:hypothetical protein
VAVGDACEVVVDLGVAIAAIDGPSLTGIEGNGGNDGAFCAFGADLDSLFFTSCAGEFNRLKPLVFSFFTLLTSFRRVLELLVAKKQLFTGGPDKFLSAVDTPYRPR